jgi:hypothetical protein
MEAIVKYEEVLLREIGSLLRPLPEQMLINQANLMQEGEEDEGASWLMDGIMNRVCVYGLAKSE